MPFRQNDWVCQAFTFKDIYSKIKVNKIFGYEKIKDIYFIPWRSVILFVGYRPMMRIGYTFGLVIQIQLLGKYLGQGLWKPINRSIELVELQDGGSQGHGAVVSSFSLAVAESDEGVDAGSLLGQIVVGNREEGSDDIDVDEDAVVLGRGGDVVLADEVGLVEVVPVGVSVELVGNGALLLHIGSDVEGALAVVGVGVVVESHRLVVEVKVAGHSDGSISVDDHHVLIGAKGQAHDEGIDVDGVVVGSAASFVAVAESDEGVDLGLLGGFGPGGDDQEGANDVSVDGEVKVLEGRVNASIVDGVGVSQVVPVFGLEEGVNVGPDVEEGDGSLSLCGGDRGAVEVRLGGGTRSHYQSHAKSDQDEGVQLIHTQLYQANDSAEHIQTTTNKIRKKCSLLLGKLADLHWLSSQVPEPSPCLFLSPSSLFICTSCQPHFALFSESQFLTADFLGILNASYSGQVVKDHEGLHQLFILFELDPFSCIILNQKGQKMPNSCKKTSI